MTMTEVSSPEEDIPVYLAVTDGEGPWPGVVVIHDALGISTDLRNQAAGHSFLNNHDPADVPWIFEVLGRLSFSEYHPASAEDACRRITGFFHQHLGAG